MQKQTRRDTREERRGDGQRRMQGQRESSSTASRRGGQSPGGGEVGEENGGGKRVRRENVSPKVKAARRRQQGSRSVRKWSFNGLPSPRQICHPRLLGGSPRAFRLLITSFQPAPSIPCLMPIISSVPWLEALRAPRPIFQRRRPRPRRGRPKRA